MAKVASGREQKRQQPLRRRHVPQRTCIACRRTDSKRTLVRVVRTPDGSVRVDPTGKQAGRGAYLCSTQECWNRAFKGSMLNRALKTTVTEQDLAALREYAANLPTESENMDEGPTLAS